MSREGCTNRKEKQSWLSIVPTCGACGHGRTSNVAKSFPGVASSLTQRCSRSAEYVMRQASLPYSTFDIFHEEALRLAGVNEITSLGVRPDRQLGRHPLASLAAYFCLLHVADGDFLLLRHCTECSTAVIACVLTTCRIANQIHFPMDLCTTRYESRHFWAELQLGTRYAASILETHSQRSQVDWS
jgi:hypothetical protein